MFQILGYNFLEDVNALDPTPTFLNDITNTTLQNGIFNHYTVSGSTSFEYNKVIPTMWDFLTIMDANFNGNIRAGNIDVVASSLTKVRIKRRIKGTFDWIILYDVPVTGPESLSFIKDDNLAQSEVEYEYAIVPMINDNELNYITNSIVSKFNGIFICDMNNIFKYYADVEYSSSSRVNRTTVFEPIGSKYPVVVSNSLINYESGSINGTVITNSDLLNGTLDRISEVKYRKELLDFATNKKVKVLKDWNGNIWLMVVINSPSISYFNNIGMGLAKVSIDYVQVGDANSAKDLYKTGMIDITSGGL